MTKNMVSFMPTLQTGTANTAIVPYEAAFAEEVMLIANKFFGEGYMDKNRLKAMTGGEGSFYAAVTNSQVSGYCFFPYVSAEVCALRMKLPKELLVKNSNADGMVCQTKTMAVDEPFRKTGTADALFEACLNKAVCDGLLSAWGSAWKIGGVIPMERIFLKNEFRLQLEVPYIWYDDRQYKCIVCGGRCRCTGIIYYKLLG